MIPNNFKILSLMSKFIFLNVVKKFFRIPISNRKGRPRKKKSRNAKGFVIREIDNKDVYIELK